ncbi:MAG: hypothetical protein ACJAUG_003525 [Halioglobus sp.]|jgi:hypothetical protein
MHKQAIFMTSMRLRHETQELPGRVKERVDVATDRSGALATIRFNTCLI